jgi:hypothetical protein
VNDFRGLTIVKEIADTMQLPKEIGYKGLIT